MASTLWRKRITELTYIITSTCSSRFYVLKKSLLGLIGVFKRLQVILEVNNEKPAGISLIMTASLGLAYHASSAIQIAI